MAEAFVRFAILESIYPRRVAAGADPPGASYRPGHRCHHGFALAWWDRRFDSYSAEPADGYEGMEIGSRGYEDRSHQLISLMLALPFLSQKQRIGEE